MEISGRCPFLRMIFEFVVSVLFLGELAVDVGAEVAHPGGS